MRHLRQQGDATAHDAHQEDVRALSFEGDHRRELVKGGVVELLQLLQLQVHLS